MGSAERGENPTVLARMRTGWAVIGDTQHLPGYCLLLYAGRTNHLTDLPRPERAQFLLDLSLLGEAVETACKQHDRAFRRLNYEVLGNSWQHLHGHIHPRYAWEPPELLRGPVWRYGPERTAPEHRLSPQHDVLRADITRALRSVLAEAYESGSGMQ
ncbi:DeoR family transcriptional regulator [Streptomyces thermospinosisporus]|uniref:DeoR family transcriptional regulator n=1 Tax=Streptomyces thermospinosisporus TaxID=161482 RepID=A0ABP4JCS0_9ACTN